MKEELEIYAVVRKNRENGEEWIDAEDDYYEELERLEAQRETDLYLYGGGFQASKGDYEGACLAQAEYEAGYFS